MDATSNVPQVRIVIEIGGAVWRLGSGQEGVRREADTETDDRAQATTVKALRSTRSSSIPVHTELIPQAVVFTVAEVAVWLGWMPFGSAVKSKVYNAATERVRGLIQRGELPARVIGGKSYVVSGFALREYLDGADSPITATGH